MSLLEVRDLHRDFRGLAAVGGVTVHVDSGEILGLIGPNGAGKTTFFNVISGFLRPTSGTALFKGEEIGGLPPHRIARKGLVRTFQATNLFFGKSVAENMLIAHHLHAKAGPWRAFFNVRSYRQQEAEIRDRTEVILKAMGLLDQQEELAENLPHGHQRALGVAMALAGDPQLLLLDEPVTGMLPAETSAFMEMVRHVVRERGITLILVEHDMKTVMGTCNRIVVLSYGKKIAEGSPQEIMHNQEVIKAYLGAE